MVESHRVREGEVIVLCRNGQRAMGKGGKMLVLLCSFSDARMRASVITRLCRNLMEPLGMAYIVGGTEEAKV